MVDDRGGARGHSLGLGYSRYRVVGSNTILLSRDPTMFSLNSTRDSWQSFADGYSHFVRCHGHPSCANPPCLYGSSRLTGLPCVSLVGGFRHTAYPNLSDDDRRNIIALFQPANTNDGSFGPTDLHGTSNL